LFRKLGEIGACFALLLGHDVSQRVRVSGEDTQGVERLLVTAKEFIRRRSTSVAAACAKVGTNDCGEMGGAGQAGGSGLIVEHLHEVGIQANRKR
jgi:hypothetical protein